MLQVAEKIWTGTERKELKLFIADLLLALMIAILLTSLFGLLFRGLRKGSEIWIFFLILFLASWAGGIWLTPFGQPIFGVSWLSFLSIGLFTALVLTALIPPSRPQRMADTPKAQTGQEARAVFNVDIFFWVLLLGLFVAILVAYM